MSSIERQYQNEIDDLQDRIKKLEAFVSRMARMETQDEIEPDHLADDSIETLNILIKEARILAEGTRQ